ncbi:ribosome biogenesis ATPase [Rozella allomycis CSF55]|uniref:RNA cytidine acetyltransferase n=1 Tax=Rozella allomycis (strain CSF55) TaxID=988480 RepID=A0A4P9YP06_ROZAC|nr:ribosome biogenesis ATPase [Rozella allomycis CSF55]
MKKKIDSRIKTLLENSVAANQRSLFVLIGDRGKDQVVHLHYMLGKTNMTRPSVLWCYKKELGFTTHRKKRMNQIKKKKERGMLDPETEDPFELFISSTDIRYAYYKETDKILGNTYGMCVLQDFEALTPNLLARTIETVQGGGIVVLLLRTMDSLKQLYTMTMDVHSRYRTEVHEDVVARFNERFLLSLTKCENSIVLDDQWNVLPISESIRGIKAIDENDLEKIKESNPELIELKESLKETQPVGSLVELAKTIDQAKALLVFVEAIADKSLRNIATLTASRGRGKSAALGLAIAAAVAYGYSNIFVTSPSPENLKTLFQFILKGFDALGFEEHLDYDLVQSTNPDFNKAVVRVNIFKNHRQTIQYIQPQDAHVLGQAELVVIDEAAAIPLPVVKKLIGNYLVFMASTIHGYEGTGRSLSLKLIKQLRENSNGKVLKEVTLDEPIRYSLNDPIEKWLNGLLCLDSQIPPKTTAGCPHPDECELFYVNRDTLFSFHNAAESFLQRMVALYVSSHYKNTPNDLQLMSDAPAHHLFVLLPPVDPNSNKIPEILCVIQVCLEGEISKKSILASLARGQRGGGDLIPWTVAQQFQDDEFSSLSGARIVRIATHPDYQKMGYGTRALSLLEKFYNGEIPFINEEMHEMQPEEQSHASLLEEKIQPRKNLPPLLSKLSEVKAPLLHWVGVSYGLTLQLFRFYQKKNFIPVYLRQTRNELTGEHTCIMLKKLDRPDCSATWLEELYVDFKKRFIQLLSFDFSAFSPQLALTILDYKVENTSNNFNDQFLSQLTSFDLKRLRSYSNQLVDYHLILDLVPQLALFNLNTNLIEMSPVQSAILTGVGAQRKSLDDLQKEINLPMNQLLAMFVKIIKKFVIYLEKERNEKQTVDNEPKKFDNDNSIASKPKKDYADEEQWDPTRQTLDEDLEEASDEATKLLKEKQNELIKAIDVDQYAVAGTEKDWNDALQNGKKLKNVVSIQNPTKKRSLEILKDVQKEATNVKTKSIKKKHKK